MADAAGENNKEQKDDDKIKKNIVSARDYICNFNVF